MPSYFVQFTFGNPNLVSHLISFAFVVTTIRPNPTFNLLNFVECTAVHICVYVKDTVHSWFHTLYSLKGRNCFLIRGKPRNG